MHVNQDKLLDQNDAQNLFPAVAIQIELLLVIIASKTELLLLYKFAALLKIELLLPIFSCRFVAQLTFHAN